MSKQGPEGTKAWEELYAIYHEPLIKFCWKRLRAITGINDWDKAKSLAQEALIKAWHKAGSFKENSKVSSWLCGIAKNLVWEEIRDIERRRYTFNMPKQEGESGEEQEVDTEADPALQVAKEVQSEAIHREVQKALSWLETSHPEFFNALRLRFYDRLSYQEIAALTGVPLNTVKSRISRGQRLLANYLKASGCLELIGNL